MKKLSVVFLFLSLIISQPHFVTAKNILTRQNNWHLTRQNNWRSRRGTVRIGKYINKIHRVIARLGTSPKIIIIDKDIALKADVNIPDNITVKIMENGSITLGDYDLIIHKIEAGPHPCFICNGSGQVTLGTGITGIYPQWFGAKGDGLADDSVALQNTLLLSSDTGIPIIITEGSTFQTTERLYCYGKCTMKGSGENCVISLDETIADHWINIGISAFIIEGDWATGSFEKVHFQINNSSFTGDALFLHRVNGFSLKNCTFTLNNLCSGIKAGNNPAFTLNPYHNNIEITGCRMIASQEAEGGKGIDLSHSTTVTITDNYIFGIGDDPIALHDCKDFIIKNNNCFSVTGRIASYNSIYGSIANNYITRVQNPHGDYEAGTALIYLGTDTFEDNSLYTSNNIEITNNDLICPPNSIDAGYILSCSGGREITIDNNTIKNNSPYTSGAICLTPTYYTGTWTDPDGIDADNTARSKDITISNNIIHGTETTGMGIHVQGTSAENISIKISNNLASSYDAPDNVLLEQNYEFNDPDIDQLPASFENLDSLKAKWFGSSFDDTTLQEAITAIGSDHWTLHISRGTWKIDEDLTFNANTQLMFEEGAVFDIKDVKITINGTLDAGLYKIFDVGPNGNVLFSNGAVSKIHPEWWGAKGNASNGSASTNTLAIQKAFNAMNNCVSSFMAERDGNPAVTVASYPTIMFLGEHYKIDDVISVGAYVVAEGSGKTIIEQTNDEKGIFNVYAYQARIEGINFLYGTRALYFHNVNVNSTMIDIENCDFTLHRDYAIYTHGTSSSGEQVTALSSAPSAGDYTITVDNPNDIEDGEDIAIYNDNYEPHYSYVNGSPAGNIVTLWDAIPTYWDGNNAASIGCKVKTGNFHMSCNLSIKDCKFTEPRKVLMNICNAARVKNCWVTIKKENFDSNAAAFYSGSGVLYFDGMFGVPGRGKGDDWQKRVRWVDCHSSLDVINSRFGGEDAGMPIVYSFLEYQNVPYYQGGYISIQRSACLAGAAAISDSSIINLRKGLPQLIILRDNTWVIMPYILNEGDSQVDLTALIAALVNDCIIKIEISPHPYPNAIPSELYKFLNIGSYP